MLDSGPAALESGFYLLLIDGGWREPGRGSIGVVLKDPRDRDVPDGEISAEIEQVPAQQRAEFRALIEGLHLAHRKNIEYLAVFSNSMTLVNQVTGRFGIKDEDNDDLRSEASRELEKFTGWQISWIPKEWNLDAHGLASRAFEGDDGRDATT
jgi:ribonuclease HI